MVAHELNTLNDPKKGPSLTTGRDCLWDCFSEKGEGNGMFFNEKIFKSKLGRERQNRLTKLLVKRKDYAHRVEDE